MTKNLHSQLALDLAFEAGKWVGQVELEEHFDREQYSRSIGESCYATHHSMPFYEASISRDVIINLRSQKWRDEVRKDAEKYLDKAKNYLATGAAI